MTVPPLRTAPPDERASTARFRITERSEIASVLRGLQASRSLVTIVYGSDPRHSFVTTLLVVDPDEPRVAIDCAVDSRRNDEAIRAPALVLHGQAEGIRIECNLGPARRDLVDGQPAIATAFPPSLFRWQRRTAFRVRVPRDRGAICEIRIGYGFPSERIRARVHDISVTGVALMGFPPGLALSPGTVFESALLHLDHESIVVDLRLVHVFRRPGGPPDGGRLAGCVLLGATPQALRRIERFVVERDGRATHAP